jgi:hypothetical protein
MLVGWTDHGPVARGEPSRVVARVVGVEGPRGDDFPIHPGAGNQGDVVIAGAPAGALMVVWSEETQDGVADVRTRAIGFDGAPIGEGDVLLNTIHAEDQDDPSIAAGPKGTLVAWGDKSLVPPDTSLDSVRFRFTPHDASMPCEP